MSGVRSLELLSKSGSTSRVLNLHRVEAEFGDDPAHAEAPFFDDPVLNRAILVKHRLRADETYLMPRGASVATKIIFPIDRKDLRTGGQSILVHQTGFKNALFEVLGARGGELDSDLRRLDLIDELPSLDPFLVREQLRRHGIRPADCYFSISPADAGRMLDFAGAEIVDLIRLAFGGAKSEVDGEQVKRLAEALLSTRADQRLDPLRLTLGLQGEQFKAGIFSWKGFIYYKWQFADLRGGLRRVATDMEEVRFKGRVTRSMRDQIAELRVSIRAHLRAATVACQAVLSLYDDAFRDLVDRGNAAAFRRFLLEAPKLFTELGRDMGLVSHIASYWTYRFKPGADHVADPEEFLDILREFENALAPTRKSAMAW